MKKLFTVLVLLALTLTAGAQTVKFGYFSYDKVMKTMSEYATAMHDVAVLKSQYDAEAKRSEEDFNAKYVEFLDEQDRLATSIRRKRQAELVDLMEKNQAFKQQAEQMLRNAEDKALDSVRQKLNEVVAEVGREHGYAFILNTDNNNLPYVNSEMGEDATLAIQEKLR